MLIQHSEHMAVSNIIQLYLNLDINKHQNLPENDNRLKVKQNILSQIIKTIEQCSQKTDDKSLTIVDNLCGILC